MAIYTKTGDKGKTSTFKGIRVSKSSSLIEAIGAIDELNSFLGIIGKQESIQKNLFLINSILSGSRMSFPKDEVKILEKKIDEWEGALPVLKNFIHYGGSRKASLIYYSRALTRKAERKLVSLSKQKKVNPGIMIYMNRLSDYLFMLARYENFKVKAKVKIWKI